MRAPVARGDTVVVSTVAGTGHKDYPLAAIPNNVSYEDVSDQPEVQPNQPLAWPISFHGGMGDSVYTPASAGYVSNTGLLVNEPNVIRAAPDDTTVTLTGAANPVQYFFETAVNDAGADDGKPVLYAIAPEAAEINAYKISLDSANFGTLLNTKTFAVTPTQPCCRPTEWNDGTNTYWRLGTGDPTNMLDSLTSIVSSTAADTWSAGGDADARHLQLFGNQLARSTSSNEICLLARGANPETEASWGDEFYVGDEGTNITELGEASGCLYIAKEDGFYEFDGVGDAVNILPIVGRAPRNGQGMTYWHGGFLIPGTNLYWTRTGQPVGPDSNPNNQGHDGTLLKSNYSKFGRWHGIATIGSVFYALYYSPGTSDKCILLQGRERGSEDVNGWGPIVFHSLRQATGDNADFHGVHIAETSEFSATVTRPSLWYANGNNVSYIWLNSDGTPFSEPGSMDVTGAAIISSSINLGLPEEINKQLRVIECVAENMNTGSPVTGSFTFAVRRNGGALEDVGSAITTSQKAQCFWTQDTNDTARWLLLCCTYAAGSDATDTNVPTLRNIVLRALALPDTTRVWTFLLTARDKSGKTGKLVRSELEVYKNDLKKYELPDGDSFNGVLTKLRLLRADEVKDLTPRNQKPPHYIMQATVREMVSS